MSVPNNDKNRAKNSVFFDCIFYLILEGFWGGFGRALGGVLELFFATWGYFFEFARTFLDKLLHLKELVFYEFSKMGPGGSQGGILDRFGDFGGILASFFRVFWWLRK